MENTSLKGLRILLVGNGGRESALAWKLSQSSKVDTIFVVPGNGGTAVLPKTANISTVSTDDYPGLVDLAQELCVDLVVPGPDVPVVEGIEGYFRKAGIPCFGPSKEAARLEGSKTYAKEFMERYKIPTAEYRNFDDYDKAKSYIEGIDHKIVIKASGLAAGKGVILPQTKEEGLAALKEIMMDRVYGDAGKEVVIEEFLEGEEVSILTFSDGVCFTSMLPAQDHKRIFDFDQGPNTGGMGCYAPTNVISSEELEHIDRTILQPTFAGLVKEGNPFVGLLFTGFMLTKSGPKVLEYNVRFGDPETQTLIPLLTDDTDLAEVMMACATGDMGSTEFEMSQKASAVVFVVSGGYPGVYETGFKITIDQQPTDISGDLNFFHAGTTLVDGELRTCGGRVMAVSATADTLENAVNLAYEGVSMVHFEGMFYRKDIARRALLDNSRLRNTTL